MLANDLDISLPRELEAGHFFHRGLSFGIPLMRGILVLGA